MNLDALPQTVLLIMAEFSVGSLIAVLVADARGMAASFVKVSAGLVVAAAALTLLAAVNASSSDPAGYHLHGGLFGPVREGRRLHQLCGYWPLLGQRAHR